LLDWADERRRLMVRTNADTPEAVEPGRGVRAQGIGLCRTEHMFFGADRIVSGEADDPPPTAKREGEKALDKIFPMQEEDFKASSG